MKLDGTRCPICGNGRLRRHEGELTLHYKGGTFRYMNGISYRCEECGEEFSAAGENKESDRAFIDFCREVDGLLKPSEIRDLRKELGLTQAALATLLDVGEKTFARYETGRVAQGKAMDTLLRILRDVPQARELVLRKVPSAAPQRSYVYHASAQAAPSSSRPFIDQSARRNTFCSCTIGG